MEEENKENTPNFTAYTVTGSEEKSRWVRIGAAWHKDGSDYIRVQLDALPVNDELVLKHYTPDEKKGDD